MFQFIHIEDYALKASRKKSETFNLEVRGKNVAGVLGEANRLKSHSRHVPDPKPPILLYGKDLNQVRDDIDYYFKNTKLVNSKGIERGLRKDSNVLLAGVISINKSNSNIWENYKKDAIEYLKDKYGHRLKSVVEHKDEQSPHVHFYCLADPGETFDLIHDGKKAMRECDGSKQEKNIAYKNAMREFQDDFYKKVSEKYGLYRDGGPKKRGRIKGSTEDYKYIQKVKKQAYKEGYKRGLAAGESEFKNKNIINKFITSRNSDAQEINKLVNYFGSLYLIPDNDISNKIISNHENILNKNARLKARKDFYKKEKKSLEEKLHSEKDNYEKSLKELKDISIYRKNKLNDVQKEKEKIARDKIILENENKSLRKFILETIYKIAPEFVKSKIDDFMNKKEKETNENIDFIGVGDVLFDIEKNNSEVKKHKFRR